MCKSRKKKNTFQPEEEYLKEEYLENSEHQDVNKQIDHDVSGDTGIIVNPRIQDIKIQTISSVASNRLFKRQRAFSSLINNPNNNVFARSRSYSDGDLTKTVNKLRAPVTVMSMRRFFRNRVLKRVTFAADTKKISEERQHKHVINDPDGDSQSTVHLLMCCAGTQNKKFVESVKVKTDISEQGA